MASGGSSKRTIADSLERDLCSFCGACLAVCPKGALSEKDPSESKPCLNRELCVDCGLCGKVCPQVDLPSELYDAGSYRFLEAYEARATDNEVLERAQDGGAVTALLLAALEAGLIDAALAVKRDEEWHPIPVIARTREEVLECCGTKYVYAPTLRVLKEIAAANDITRVAVVGVPCQIRAVNKMREAKLLKYTRKIAFTIGLFCTHNFSWKSLNKLLGELGVQIRDVERMEIRKGKFTVTLKNGDKRECPVEKTFSDLRPSCEQCPEFISRYADVNVGSIGSPQGWSTVLVMNEKGAELLKEARKQGLLETRPLGEKGRKLVERFIERKLKSAAKEKRQ